MPSPADPLTEHARRAQAEAGIELPLVRASETEWAGRWPSRGSWKARTR